MLNALLNYLNAYTDIPFVELAWSHSPDEKYGVINLDNQIALDADADPVSEKMLTGFVDVFVKKPKDLSTVSDVESAMKRLGIYFALNSVQFEDDTGYVHYEWTWRDSTGAVVENICVVRFVDYAGTLIDEQLVSYGEKASVPRVVLPSFTSNGIVYSFAAWNPPPNTTTITQNTVIKAVYNTSVALIESYRPYLATNPNSVDIFTTEQIADLIEHFVIGYRINVFGKNTRQTTATAIDENGITWDGGYAVWRVQNGTD